ncbi:MAG: mobile mystery protein B [Candidatus Binatia bacterium]
MLDSLPAGATPLDPDEAEGLIPEHLSTRGELNAWEQVNVAKADNWLRRQQNGRSVLNMGFLRELHRQMFSDTWKWAGKFRWTLKNIGVPPETIPEQTYNLLADTRYWIEHHTYSVDEIAVRFHHRLVAIHPFPNGNGRHGRLMTDALLRKLHAPPFTWGSGSIDDRGAVRDRYIHALRSADSGDYAPLLAFVRS